MTHRTPVRDRNHARRHFYASRPLTERAAFERLAPGNYHRISRASGLSLQHVSRVLRGIRGASFDTASLIARAAGVSLDQLHAYRTANRGIGAQ